MLIMKASKSNEDAETKQLEHLPKQNCNEWEAGHSEKTLGHVNAHGAVASGKKRVFLKLFYLLLWSELINNLPPVSEEHRL